MTKAKLREVKELQRFECISLGQRMWRGVAKAFLALAFGENKDQNIGLGVC
jgi:hypothetical protein